ncbi:hypothetical protein JTB14_001238 [Gonioctena quinquepunctata]|nr:hypothetical protein JTB14_001238 [Gonioctena quinquepunctata]
MPRSRWPQENNCEVQEVLDQEDNYSQTEQSEKESQIIASATPSIEDTKTKLRFNDEEIVIALKELFNISCEDGLDNEPELWVTYEAS